MEQFIFASTLKPLFAVGFLDFQWHLFAQRWALTWTKEMGIMPFPFLSSLFALSSSLYDGWFQSVKWKWFSAHTRTRPMFWCVSLFSSCVSSLLKEALSLEELSTAFLHFSWWKAVLLMFVKLCLSFFSCLCLWLGSIFLFLSGMYFIINLIKSQTYYRALVNKL